MSLKIIPGDISNLEPGEKKVLNILSSIYSSVDYTNYLYIQPRLKKLNPDFLLIDAYKGVCIIEVKDWSIGYIKAIHNSYVIDIKDRRINNPAFRTNQYFNFAKRILQLEPFFIDEKGFFNLNIYSKVIFTNLNAKELEGLAPFLFQPPTECISSDQMRTLSFDTLFSTNARFLDEKTISLIRGTLFSEIIVKPIQTELWEFNRKNPLENRVMSALDAEQEKFARRIPFGHYMITGVPGSGKTVILLSRAIHLIKENPSWKIRILTYNKSLARKLQNRFDNLYEKLELMGVNCQNITISTFHSLASEVSNITPPPIITQDYWDVILPFNAIENAKPTMMGCKSYPEAKKLMITADCGGSNGYRLRLWKTELQKLADEIGLEISVCHFPPGTSKWNKIEHRLFSHITMNWRGKPLISYEVIVNLIAATTTSKGLKVKCMLDKNEYPKGIKIKKKEVEELGIIRDEFHGEWNYTFKPSNKGVA